MNGEAASWRIMLVHCSTYVTCNTAAVMQRKTLTILTWLAYAKWLRLAHLDKAGGRVDDLDEGPLEQLVAVEGKVCTARDGHLVLQQVTA